MTSGSRSLRLLLGLFAWTLAATAAARAADRFEAPDAGAVLGSGAAAHVGWRLSGTPQLGFAEMEIVLSLDGGRTFPIRVTRDLGPTTRTITWRGAALPTRHARLALRTGDGEEPDAESIRLVSDEFAIEAGAASPLEPTRAVRGEWRVREALETGASQAPLPPPALDAENFAFRIFPDLPDVVAPRQRVSAEASAPSHDDVLKPGLESPTLPTHSALPRTPTNTPRRE